MAVGMLYDMVSCSGFEEMNQNPSQITYGESTPSKLLQDVIYSGHWTVLYRSWRINGQLMQYAIQTNGTSLTCSAPIGNAAKTRAT